MKIRADELLAQKDLAQSRSQAAHLIKLGKVIAGKKPVTKPGQMLDESSDIKIELKERYVSRAGFKLASVASVLKLEFRGKVILDVGSSTGGFTDYALRRGAKKVVAVDVGTKQLHPSLLGDQRIELHEQTDIRNVWLRQTEQRATSNEQRVLIDTPDIIIIDVSFISLREILPHCSLLTAPHSLVVAMVKPQFEARQTGVKHKGVLKNNAMRRKVLKDFEAWAKNVFVIVDKADSGVSGTKGNIERFYLLKRSK